MKKRLATFFAITLLAVAALQFAACDPFLKEKNDLKPSNVSAVTLNETDPGTSQNKAEATLENCVDKVFRSVVYITNRTATSIGYGCGVIVDINATNVGGDTISGDENILYVYTCYHVVDNFSSLTLSIPKVPTYSFGGETKFDYAAVDYEAYVFSTAEGTLGFVGGDFYSDVAVLKLDYSAYKNELIPVKAEIAEDFCTLGQTVFAVGNPTGGLSGTVTSGVVSSLNRTVSVDEIGQMKLMQFDTAINSGNSGGGLFNLSGKLVGIVSAGNSSYENLGFAIPTTFSSPTKTYAETEDLGFVNVAEKLITTAWSDESGNYNYGYFPGRWALGLTVSVSGGFRNYGYVSISSVEKGSPFYGVAASLTGQYLYSLTFKGKTHVLITGTTYPYILYEEVLTEMNAALSIGDTVGIAVGQTGSRSFTATLTQKIYRDTGMTKAA